MSFSGLRPLARAILRGGIRREGTLLPQPRGTHRRDGDATNNVFMCRQGTLQMHTAETSEASPPGQKRSIGKGKPPARVIAETRGARYTNRTRTPGPHHSGTTAPGASEWRGCPPRNRPLAHLGATQGTSLRKEAFVFKRARKTEARRANGGLWVHRSGIPPQPSACNQLYSIGSSGP